MDNKQKKLMRRGFSAIGIFFLFFSLLTYAGLELPLYNHYNPLYNPYYYIFIAFIFFISRTYVRDKKGIGNFIDFFDRSGLVVASYEIPFENIKPTHANYVDKEGEKSSIRHSHPFAIPDKDNWTNEFLVPTTGLEALHPTKLIKKYGAQLKDEVITVIGETEGKDEKGNIIKVFTEKSEKITKDIVRAILSNLSAWIPEIQALDPNVLHDDYAEVDNVDSINQEAAYQIAEIRKGWFTGAKTGQIIMYVALGVLVGVVGVTFTFLLGHVDFSHINGNP